MKVYLHKIFVGKNSFSLRGFPLSGSGSGITRHIQPLFRRLREPRSEAIRSMLSCWYFVGWIPSGLGNGHAVRQKLIGILTIYPSGLNCGTAAAAYSVPMMHPPMLVMIIRALAFLTGPFRLVNQQNNCHQRESAEADEYVD